MPIDPVCGIEMDESLALIHEHDGEIYIFVVICFIVKWKRKNISSFILVSKFFIQFSHFFIIC